MGGAVLAENLAADDTMMSAEEEVELTLAFVAALCLLIRYEVSLSLSQLKISLIVNSRCDFSVGIDSLSRLDWCVV